MSLEAADHHESEAAAASAAAAPNVHRDRDRRPHSRQDRLQSAQVRRGGNSEVIQRSSRYHSEAG